MVLAILRNPKIQLILRYVNDFFKRNPIHCTSYLSKNYIHWIEFLYWVLSISFMFNYGFICGMKLLNDYSSRNTGITMDIDYIRLKFLLPAVTICPHDIIDDQKLTEYVSNFKDKTNQNDLKNFLLRLSKITGKSAKHLEFTNIQIPAKDYMQIIFNLSRHYEVLPQNKAAVKIMTEVGICYTINSFLYEEIYTKNWGDLQSYPKKLIDRYVDNKTSYNFTQTYPLELEIPHNITGDMTIYIHAPNEVPTIWSRPAFITNQKEFSKISVIVKELTITEKYLEQTTVEERHCRNTTESNLKMFPSTYSRNLCLMACRAKYIIELCNCLPHFYHNHNWNDIAVCNIQGLNCFTRHSAIIRTINANPKSPIFKCYQCYPNCVDQIVLKKITRLSAKNKYNDSISLFIESPPLSSFQRSVMYSKLDFIVTLSSVLSAFFGFCIYSLCDFLYFFTIRIYWFRMGYQGSLNDDF